MLIEGVAHSRWNSEVVCGAFPHVCLAQLRRRQGTNRRDVRGASTRAGRLNRLAELIEVATRRPSHRINISNKLSASNGDQALVNAYNRRGGKAEFGMAGADLGNR